jgi:mycofactocin system glycosyltransferase
MTLPAGFTVRLNSMTDIVDGGVALVGGSPTRYVRLSAAAQKSIINREVSAATPIGAQLADKLLELAMAEPVVDLLPECDAEYTIVIPVMNRATSLARLLSSIVDATAPTQPRIIVVDDASANPQEIEQVALRFGATFHGLETNQGPATARNAGLALVDTEFVVFLDSDVVINPATIPTLLKHFADPKVAVAAPRISALNHNGGWIAQYEDTNSSLDLGAEPSAIKPRSKMSWTSSSALVARTLALADGFDSQMRIGEDVDLIWRLSKAGWRIRYEPAAVAQHEHRAGFVHWFKRRFDYGTGAVPLARRHPEAIAPAILAPWGIGVILALLIQRKWSLPLALGIAVWAAFSGSRRLASAQHPLALSVQLTAKGVGSAYTQASALMLRHWWPLTFIGCLLSRRIRKATLALALADIGLDYVRKGSRLDPVRFGAARRLDDIAYGAGVWLASLRAGTLAALTPQITRPQRTPDA